jgi:hypothetical protein
MKTISKKIINDTNKLFSNNPQFSIIQNNEKQIIITKNIKLLNENILLNYEINKTISSYSYTITSKDYNEYKFNDNSDPLTLLHKILKDNFEQVYKLAITFLKNLINDNNITIDGLASGFSARVNGVIIKHKENIKDNICIIFNGYKIQDITINISSQLNINNCINFLKVLTLSNKINNI